MLYYVPLESYKERYTMQWSAPKTGWLERNWIKEGIEYFRVEGVRALPQRKIKVGCVLDGVGRSLHCYSQNEELLLLAEQGKITDNDIIYFDDFWHPGLESLPYAFHLLGIKPKMFAFLHAQSVDEFDFTYPMRSWMRFFEKGIGEVLNGIFVCGPCLRDLVVFGGIAAKEKVFVTGHPFNSEEVRERMPATFPTHRKNHIIFSSRWDDEKNPLFFLQVAKTVIERNKKAKFIVCTSAEKLRSNNQENLFALEQYRKQYPENILLMEGLTKEEYYKELCDAKIQVNTADQDFVAITLLEASVAGCYPVYPYFRSFPETLRHSSAYTYTRLDVEDAAQKILSVLKHEDLWTPKEIEKRSWIHARFDTAWKRMLLAMTKGKVEDDPYAI